MRRTFSFLLVFAVAACAIARADDAGAIPPWATFGGGPAAYAFALDPAQPRGGAPSLRIAALKPGGEEFGASSWSLDAAPYRGKRVRLTGDVKTAGAGSASLWLRVDGSRIGGFDNMTAEGGRGDRALHGDHPWTPLHVDLDVPGDAMTLVFGHLIFGGGTMWSTYPRLEVLGTAQSAAARDAKPAGALDPAQRAAVEAALRRAAHKLRTVDPEAPLDDLAPFDRDVASARIVGLGEASHGTADFFRMKHRLFRDLVERHGVTVFAFEANLTEAREMDRYVTTGEGDPAHALHSLYFWTWQTQEVVALAKWMRAYNAAPGKHATLHFAGFDAQYAGVAAEAVQRFAAARSATAGEVVKARYACLPVMAGLRAMTADAKRACTASVTTVAALLEPLHPDADVARDARVVEQFAAISMSPDSKDSGFAARDAAMAENVAWLAETRYRGAKLALWAHNFHIGSQTSGSAIAVTMGEHLRQHFGPAYVRVGFAFDRGTITAAGAPRLGTKNVAPAPPGTLEALLNDVAPELYLSLRTLPAGDPFASWLDAGTLSREPGALYTETNQNAFFAVSKERERFDALIFVAESHASSLLPGALPSPSPSPSS